MLIHESHNASSGGARAKLNSLPPAEPAENLRSRKLIDAVNERIESIPRV